MLLFFFNINENKRILFSVLYIFKLNQLCDTMQTSMHSFYLYSSLENIFLPKSVTDLLIDKFKGFSNQLFDHNMIND